jgi:Kef-type K+ transport system membrane component KefB
MNTLELLTTLFMGILLCRSLLSPIGIPHFFSDITAGFIIHKFFFPNLALIPEFNLLKDMGLILLMFYTGYEMSAIKKMPTVCHLTMTFSASILLSAITALVGLSAFSWIQGIGAHSSNSKYYIFIILISTVTSIPVISKIFAENNVTQTKFAQWTLSLALVQDIFIFMMMNILTSPEGGVNEVLKIIFISAFCLFILSCKNYIYTFLRFILKRLSVSTQEHYLIYIYSALFLTTYLLNTLSVKPVISALLCGLILGSSVSESVKKISIVVKETSMTIFVPMYFVCIGSLMDLSEIRLNFFLVSFLLLTSFSKVLLGLILGKIAHIKEHTYSLAASLNARGSPGIVLATMAYEYNLISKGFEQNLIIVSLITSLLASVVIKWQHKNS